MQGYTGHQIGPSLSGETPYQPAYQEHPSHKNPGSFNQIVIFLLGTLVILLSVAIIVGGAWAWSQINEQETAAAGFQEEARALAIERDEAVGGLQAALGDTDDLRTRLDSAVIDLEAAEEERDAAVSDLTGIEAELAEQERLLSQAREETARQQELAIKLEEIVELDDEIQWLLIDYIDVAWLAFEAETDDDYLFWLEELDYITDDVITLLELRDELIADL